MNNALIGNKIFYYKQLDSTQKEIWRQVQDNSIENGSVIVADVQTAGIGTHGRKWYTSQENNIAFSFVLFPEIEINKLKNITIIIANVIVKVFEDLYNVKLSIKNPNDIVVGTKKIGGILTQTKLQGEFVKTLVIGIGINTNQEVFDTEIESIASSIKNEFGINVDNNKVIKEFCKVFNNELIKLLGGIK